MPQSLPVLRGEVLGQCCCSIAVIDDVLGRLALLQNYFSLMSNTSPDMPASGAARILAGAWSDLRDARNLLSGLSGQMEVEHA